MTTPIMERRVYLKRMEIFSLIMVIICAIVLCFVVFMLSKIEMNKDNKEAEKYKYKYTNHDKGSKR